MQMLGRSNEGGLSLLGVPETTASLNRKAPKLFSRFFLCSPSLLPHGPV